MDIEKNAVRHYSLYSKGVSEVLMLDSNDLKVLRYFHYHMPLEFLKELELFQTYPFHLLLKRYEAVAYKYYGYLSRSKTLGEKNLELSSSFSLARPEKVITKDSENSQWIYVIKSGTAKVVKKMRLHNREPELSQVPPRGLNLKLNASTGKPRLNGQMIYKLST